MFLAAGNRDPRRFDRPGVLALGRTSNALLFFGARAHLCLGAALARMEAQVALDHLIRELPPIEVVTPPARKARLTLRGYQSLTIRRLDA